MRFETATPAFFLAALLTSAAPYATAAKSDEATMVVAFVHGVPATAKGGRYYGADVIRFDEALGFALVHASDRAAFEPEARADADVRYVAEDANVVQLHGTPNDPYYAQQYGWARMNAPAAWNVTTGSAGVIVAVLDTGVDRTHPDLAGARLLQGYDFYNNDADPNDDCSHGTHVAGILGATANNGIGVAGAAQVSILPVKVIGKDATGACTGPFSAVASGIRYAVDNGARVVSMSLGCSGCFDQLTEDAIQYALAHNVLLVASAGNTACTSCVAWPAADAGVMAVACSDQTDLQCSFSSSGPEVEITAPGRNIYSTVPGGAYMSMSGTSMSAPAIAGAAALAFSVNGALTGPQVRNMIDSTARDLGAAGRDAAFGYGIADMAAIVAAASSTPPPPANAAPTASFTTSVSNLTVSANGGASRDSDGSIVSYAWSWGDGATSTGLTATHTYAAAGSYVVKLTVTDNASATNTTSATVTVSAPPAPPATMHVAAITASLAHLKSADKLTWSVTIVDASGRVLSGTTVAASQTGSASSSLTGTTASNGVASLTYNAKRISSGQSYTLCVTGVSASGFAYDSTSNAVTCASFTA